MEEKYESVNDAEMLQAAKEILEQNLAAFEELAK